MKMLVCMRGRMLTVCFVRGAVLPAFRHAQGQGGCKAEEAGVHLSAFLCILLYTHSSSTTHPPSHPDGGLGSLTHNSTLQYVSPYLHHHQSCTGLHCTTGSTASDRIPPGPTIPHCAGAAVTLAMPTKLELCFHKMHTTIHKRGPAAGLGLGLWYTHARKRKRE